MINYTQLKAMLENRKPKTAIILGSGLGEIADRIENPLIINYTDIEGFPPSTVVGHQGKLIIGKIFEKEVLCMQGRFHLYEGYHPSLICDVIKAFKLIGIEKLLITNAAGSLNPNFEPGSLMLIEDHINFSGQNPLVGHNDEELGPRFPDMSNAYDNELRIQLAEVAAQNHIELNHGVYLMVLGPNFETPAEIRAFKLLGADAVGMSTVPEVIAAVHAGIKVAAISAITNFGAGLQNHALSHEETISGASEGAKKLTKLITMYLKEY